MPIGTPFHERTFPLCESLNYREWSGYYAVSAYEAHHEHEYNAIRNAAALIDISPLFKYRVTGKDATRLVDRIITRDVRKVSVGQVIYTPWCDEHGKVIDDGTVSRLEENIYRWTAADPSLRWFTQNASASTFRLKTSRKVWQRWRCKGRTSGRLLKSSRRRGHREPEILSRHKGNDRRACRSRFRAPDTPAIWVMKSGSPADSGLESLGRVDGARTGLRHSTGRHAGA